MADLQVVRNALAMQIQGNAYPALTAEGNPRDVINPPCALVIPPRGTFASYGKTLGGAMPVLGAPPEVMYAATEFNLDVLVVVARTDIDRTQETLDQWLGFASVPGVTVSVPAAVAMDDTLNGVVQWCEPTTADAYAPVEWGGAPYFGARIHFTIGLI